MHIPFWSRYIIYGVLVALIMTGVAADFFQGGSAAVALFAVVATAFAWLQRRFEPQFRRIVMPGDPRDLRADTAALFGLYILPSLLLPLIFTSLLPGLFEFHIEALLYSILTISAGVLSGILPNPQR